MSRIALFHSELGHRPAFTAAAERLTALGHTVHAPELFTGEPPAEPDTDALLRTAVAAVAPHSAAGLVYAGFGLGAALAQNLALADERARGLLLFHGTSDLRDDAATAIPVQLHMAEPDPYETEDWLGAWYLRMGRAGADTEVHRYHGAGHLFTDDGLPDWDAEASRIAWAAAEDFLADLDAADA